jgi:hypothetical protein
MNLVRVYFSMKKGEKIGVSHCLSVSAIPHQSTEWCEHLKSVILNVYEHLIIRMFLNINLFFCKITSM